MYCVALLESGNYAYSLCRILEKKGYVFEIVTTPCQISKGGCGYCIKLPEEYKDIIVNEGKASRMPVLEIYRIVPAGVKNKYTRIY